MDTVATVAEVDLLRKPRWQRSVAAQHVVDFEQAKERRSQREFASASGIPRTTLQGWVQRKAALNASPARVAFFESPDGQAFLHQLHVAAHLTINQECAGGLRVVSRFLERAGLAPFLGLSYGAQYDAAKVMETNILAYGAEQHQLLTKMPHVRITLVQDETFFGKIICLVAMDAVSGFIFVEEFADARDADTWVAKVKASLEGLPVTVIQSVGDAAKGLSKQARELGAQYSPDLFHPLHDVYKAIGPTVHARLRQAHRDYEESKAATQAQIDEKDVYRAHVTDRGPGRPPNFDARVQTLADAENAALSNLRELADVKERMNAAVAEISEAYHPVDLTTGKMRTPEQVQQSIELSFDALGEIADEMDVSQRGQELLAKARRMVPEMIGALGFFFKSVIAALSAADLTSEQINLVFHCLIPLAYLKMAASKAKGERRQTIRATIETLSALAHGVASPLTAATEETRVRLMELAQQCAEIFQRSSSCVEGHNGLLSLHHHAGRNLSAQRLRILTILHNFDIRRADGTTAAERLSGTEHPDLFEWLLARLPAPPRPTSPRSPRRLKAVG